MQLTKDADLMALFDRLFEASKESETGQTQPMGSTLMPPSVELSAAPVRLSDLLDRDGSVTSLALASYAAEHAPHLAQDFADLAKMIANGEVDFQPSGIPAKRLLDFVYPVV